MVPRMRGHLSVAKVFVHPCVALVFLKSTVSWNLNSDRLREIRERQSKEQAYGRLLLDT